MELIRVCGGVAPKVCSYVPVWLSAVVVCIKSFVIEGELCLYAVVVVCGVCVMCTAYNVAMKVNDTKPDEYNGGLTALCSCTFVNCH